VEAHSQANQPILFQKKTASTLKQTFWHLLGDESGQSE